MRKVQYEVNAAIQVGRGLATKGSNAPEEGDDGGEYRLVATKVIFASCECQSGAGGGCHHVCQLLQLTRLLTLTEDELRTWNPHTPTSVACRWILQHCGARRNAEHNIWHRKPVAEIIRGLRVLRDPKNHPFSGAVDEQAQTRGVVAMDRVNDYSAHPDHGKWSRAKKHFDEGKTLSHSAWEKLQVFIDGERDWGANDTRVAIDLLPPKLRPDSP